MRPAWLLALLAGCASSTPADGPKTLRRRIEQELGPGEWGVYFHDLQDGERLELRADEKFHPASTLKLLVMFTVYQDVGAGRYALDTAVPVTKTFLSAAEKDPKPFEVAPSKALEPKVGQTATVRELTELMITVSDNLATNLLIRLAGGPEAVTKLARELGAQRSDVRRWIEDEQAFQEGLSSVAVPREYGHLLERLWRGQVITQEASAGMLALMRQVKDGSMLPKKLPRGAVVAHKTGSISSVRNDVGLVTLADGRTFVAVFFSRRLIDPDRAERGIAAATRILHDHVARKPAAPVKPVAPRAGE